MTDTMPEALSASQPHPGSARDRVARGQAQEAPDQAHVAAHKAELDAARPSMRAVPVHQAHPDGAMPRTRYVAGSGYSQILSQDADRYIAHIMAIDEPVVVCATKELAMEAANQVANVPFPTGFYLPISVTLPVYSKGPLWVANTSSTPTRVSVIAERYEKPQPEPER